MRVYSSQLGRIIEVPDASPSAGIPTGGNAPTPTTGGIDYKAIQEKLFKLGLANPKNASKANTLFEMAGKLGPSDAQKEDARKKDTAVNNLELLENMYFNNGIGKGPAGGILSELEALVSPGSTYKRYKNAVGSMRPGFAKLAGDTGNLAVQEQIAQGKLFPTARFSNEEAIEAFKTARQRFGLPERDYASLVKNYGKGVSGFASQYE